MSVDGIRVVRGMLDLSGEAACIYVIGSTKTSTIPGISLAGQAPLLTLLTPALDAEYLHYGRPVTVSAIPTTPEGIPTPALITRVALRLAQLPYTVVDAGSFVPPAVPRIALPSARVGGRIDLEDALPKGTSARLLGEARAVGEWFGSLADVVLVGESIPGGTTTALAILRGLGFDAYVSSSARVNPMGLKASVVEKALSRVSGSRDALDVNDAVGDPVHVSVAGVALGALSRGAKVVLAGGTQMLAVLALMKGIDPGFDGSGVTLATTRWLFADAGIWITRFVEAVAPRASIAYADLYFGDAPYPGLRAYEEGFVKEGVGAGGTALLALSRGVALGDLLRGIYEEYSALVGAGHG